MSKLKVPVKALVKLVEYTEGDERRHYEDMRLNGEDTSDHIYLSVRAVARWLDSQGVVHRNRQEEMRRKMAAIFTSHGVEAKIK